MPSVEEEKSLDLVQRVVFSAIVVVATGSIAHGDLGLLGLQLTRDALNR